jgi:CheY-like chemotaxis protein
MARILIVDDDELDRTLLRAMLSTEGHEVVQAVDGEEGLASLGATPIDVVITDLQMPKVHGLELISVLRGVSPRPAIVAVSGTGEAQLDMAEAIGADATLSKPLTHAALLDGVRRALAAVQGRQAEATP